MASETDHAWAAGIIDGEGTIGMTINRAGQNRRATTSYQVRICVRMTHKPTIDRLGTLFGGTIKHSPPKNPRRHKVAYEWYVGDLLTEDVLTRVLPHMTTKKDQATLVLEYRRNCFKWKQYGKSQCPPGVVVMREGYRARLKALNQKGPGNAE